MDIKLAKSSWQNASLSYHRMVFLALALLIPTSLATIQDFALFNLPPTWHLLGSLVSFSLMCFLLLWTPRALAEPDTDILSLAVRSARAFLVLAFWALILVLLNLLALQMQSLILSYVGSWLLNLLPSRLSLSWGARLVGGLVTAVCLFPVLFVFCRTILVPLLLTEPSVTFSDSIHTSWQKTKGKSWTVLLSVFVPLLALSWFLNTFLRYIPELMDAKDARLSVLLMGICLRLAATGAALVYLASLALSLSRGSKSSSVNKRPRSLN